MQTTSTQQPHGAPLTSTHNDPGADLQYTTQPPRDSAYASGTPGIHGGSTHRPGELRPGEYEVSPNFSSGEVPTSPSNRHNFSYPSRNPPVGTTAVGSTSGLTREETGSSRKSGRFADLKAAAIGLHVSLTASI